MCKEPVSIAFSFFSKLEIRHLEVPVVSQKRVPTTILPVEVESSLATGSLPTVEQQTSSKAWLSICKNSVFCSGDPEEQLGVVVCDVSGGGYATTYRQTGSFRNMSYRTGGQFSSFPCWFHFSGESSVEQGTQIVSNLSMESCEIIYIGKKPFWIRKSRNEAPTAVTICYYYYRIKYIGVKAPVRRTVRNLTPTKILWTTPIACRSTQNEKGVPQDLKNRSMLLPPP